MTEVGIQRSEIRKTRWKGETLFRKAEVALREDILETRFRAKDAEDAKEKNLNAEKLTGRKTDRPKSGGFAQRTRREILKS
jgi:hypothetical protein